MKTSSLDQMNPLFITSVSSFAASGFQQNVSHDGNAVECINLFFIQIVFRRADIGLQHQ
jgi:hypothetical protein